MTDTSKDLFSGKLDQGARNVLSSARELFECTSGVNIWRTADRFASVLESVLEPAPSLVDGMDASLEHSRESVRHFIKAGSQIYGSISLVLASV
jgi:hypothetical protein